MVADISEGSFLGGSSLFWIWGNLSSWFPPTGQFQAPSKGGFSGRIYTWQQSVLIDDCCLPKSQESGVGECDTSLPSWVNCVPSRQCSGCMCLPFCCCVAFVGFTSWRDGSCSLATLRSPPLKRRSWSSCYRRPLIRGKGCSCHQRYNISSPLTTGYLWKLPPVSISMESDALLGPSRSLWTPCSISETI